MAKKQIFTYQDGDFIVCYPTHGVGKIHGTEKQQIAGAEVTLLVIRFEQDRMTLRVPLEKAMTLGLRTLSSRKHMDDAITTLKSKAKVKRAMWSRRAQEYEAKLNPVIRSILRKLSVICVNAIPIPSNPIPSVKCIRPHWNVWHVNLPLLKISIRIPLLFGWKI